MQPEREWGRLAVIRYPNRRTFFKLLSDPGYAPMEPYKFTALEIDLVPASGDYRTCGGWSEVDLLFFFC